MLTHHNSKPIHPERVIILGAHGFVGKATAENLAHDKIDSVLVGRQEIDLLSDGAAAELEQIFRPTDALLVIAAKAPVKNSAMLLENIQMMNIICQALPKSPVNHVVYVSSDAVYGDLPVPLTESNPTAPSSLHGAMHLSRELMLSSVVDGPLAILRPTLIYGAADPHNGYGPNSFRRLVEKSENIVLFGKGEEQRDHVFIGDVAELIKRTLNYRSDGILNIATGDARSFKQIAEIINNAAQNPVDIIETLRKGPMPHNGLRPFDATSTLTAFSDFRYKKIEQGLFE